MLAARRADAHRVVAPDHRSHGRGLRPDAPFSIDDCADDAAALLGTLGIDRAVAVGYSMGGSVALALARRHPDKVAGLVLAATALAAASLGAAAAPGDPVKVVYHMNEGVDHAPQALRNVRNHLSVDPKAKIVMVMHAAGINYLMKDAKDKDGIFKVGETIYRACTDCHAKYLRE